MAQSFIGKRISLVSHSDVRYRGILAGIDPAASTIQLSNVFSMGTESRRPPAEFIPPVQEPYQYIIFRASEVKDLAVDDPAPAPPRSVHDDPAVLAVPPPPPPRRNPVHTAAASLETVERALGDLRVSTARARPRPARPSRPQAHLTVPATDYDFESMNAMFDKAVADPQPNRALPPNPDDTPSAYDPAKSFFDALSPAPLPRRRGPAVPNPNTPRSRREEERERNVATFGEPGGYVGAPGAYGYQRRGGRRPRGAGAGAPR